jgi:hypothetical protein
MGANARSRSPASASRRATRANDDEGDDEGDDGARATTRRDANARGKRRRAGGGRRRVWRF